MTGIYVITPGELLIYKKVYGVRRDCMPLYSSTCGSISPYPDGLFP